VVVLTGMGGVGKTTMAAEYAHRHLAEVSVAWQVAAEDETALRQALAELAAQLGGRDVVDLRDPVASAHALLAAHPAEWLVIFDNATDEASIRWFLPPAGRGRVIVTSQSQHWPGQKVLDVPVLDDQVAARFLVSRAGNPDPTAAAELAGALGSLPLALEQVAAYTQAARITLGAYLELFRQRRSDLLARGESVGHPFTVAATISLAVSRLEAKASAAAGLLRLLACLAPEPIPLGLLLANPQAAGQLAPAVATIGPLLSDRIATADAVAALRQYSLVSPRADGLVLVHRLVQEVTLSQIPADLADQWRHTAAALVEAAIPNAPRLPAAWLVCGQLLPHALAVLDPTSSGMWRIADYLVSTGSYPAARDLYQLLADAHAADEAYGPEHRNTLIARAWVAGATGRAGDGARAREKLQDLVPIFERVLGAEHADTLTTRGELARWTGLLGDAAGARDQLAELLPIRERLQGTEHPETLTTRHNLANWVGEAGDAAGARDRFAELLPIRGRLQGAEHPETLTTRHNLASWTGEAGDAAGARDRFAELLPIRERVLGAQHPDTLTTRTALARWVGEAGDAAEARDQYEALLPNLERILGPEHSDTLTTRHNLASWTGEAGDAAGARDRFAELLPIRERVLGAQHPDTLNSRICLASWTGRAGDAAGARDQYEALLPILEELLGPQHRFTLTARGNLLHWALASLRWTLLSLCFGPLRRR
jgi:Tetratricopeptide repeat